MSDQTIEQRLDEIAKSPNYIGMGMLSIPEPIKSALQEYHEIIRDSKNAYGHKRDTMNMHAENILVLAIDEYANNLTPKENK